MPASAALKNFADGSARLRPPRHGGRQGRAVGLPAVRFEALAELYLNRPPYTWAPRQPVDGGRPVYQCRATALVFRYLHGRVSGSQPALRGPRLRELHSTRRVPGPLCYANGGPSRNVKRDPLGPMPVGRVRPTPETAPPERRHPGLELANAEITPVIPRTAGSSSTRRSRFEARRGRPRIRSLPRDRKEVPLDARRGAASRGC